MAVIFWAKSYNVKGQPQVFSIPEINIIPLGVSAISFSAMPATLRSNISDICFTSDQHHHNLHGSPELLDLRQSSSICQMAGYDICQHHGHYLPDCSRCHTSPSPQQRNTLGVVL